MRAGLIWDPATGDPIGNPLTGHNDPVLAVALGRLGDRDVIISGGNDGTVRVWNPATGTTLHVADLLGPAQGLAFGQDGQVYVATGHAICDFTLISCPDGR